MKKKFLVTGGTGFIGAPLALKLLQSGHDVRILDNGFRGSSSRLGDRANECEILTGDIRDPQVVDAAVRGVDAVCHLAFVNGTQYFYDRPAYVLDVGVKGMVNVLDSCIRRDVGELVLTSSSEVYQTPPVVPTDESVALSIPDVENPRYSYAGGKIISELMALNYGRQYLKRVVIVRPHNVFGPDMGWEHVIPQFVSRAIQSPGEFKIQGDGSQSRSFVYIDDFTDGLMCAIDRGQHLNLYHVGTTEEISMRELAGRVAAVLGISLKVIPGPEATGGTPRRCPSIAKIGALGYEPKWKLDAALRVTVEWYRSNQHLYKPRPIQGANLFIPEYK